MSGRGSVEIFRDFGSPALGGPRTLRVYLPEEYLRGSAERFGVVYLHDGQNVFDHPETAVEPSWGADLALDGLLASGRVGRWIIAAVDHDGEGRFEQYSPWPEPRLQIRGHGALYARFLTEEVKPFVDGTFRTRPEPEWTAAAGSSLGGLISLYLAWRRPGVFGRAGALSPSVMWCEGALFQKWKSRAKRPVRLYLDVGAKERLSLPGVPMDYATAVKAFHGHLVSLGYPAEELKLVVDRRGIHHESAWRRRLPSALEWLLR